MRLHSLFGIFLLCAALSAQSKPSPIQTPTKGQPAAMEYYYKVQWGHQEEFFKLFEKNHLPILRKLKDKGEIVAIKVDKPAMHATEDGRWDYRVTITFRDLEAALGDKSADYEMTKQMYPDWATFLREEQRRFEILDAHWDLLIEDYTPE